LHDGLLFVLHFEHAIERKVAHFADESEHDHRKLLDEAASDMTWDGEPISGMSDADAALLADLSSGAR